MSRTSWLRPNKGGKHEGRAAVAVLHVQVGAVGDEQFGNVGVALEAHAHQGRVAAEVLGVHVGAGSSSRRAASGWPL
jgi:hypothetical protein